jgi:hypothetical protein
LNWNFKSYCLQFKLSYGIISYINF